MAETNKRTKTKTSAKTEEAKTEEAKTETKPKADAKPKSAPKPKAAAKPKSAPRPKAAPSAENAGEARTDSAPNAAREVPNDWAKMIVNQLIEAQRMWLEMTTQQTALVFKTVSEVMGMSQNAPTEALGDWAKQGVETFITAQKQWSEIALQQSAELMQTVQSGANFGSSSTSGGAADALDAAQGAAGKGLEILVQMRTAWLDFAARQNEQMVKALKQNLKLDDSSPVAALADFAQQTMTSYVEIQKRWLDLATDMPLFGRPSKDKK